MQPGFSPVPLLSRLLAVPLVAVPLAYIAGAIDEAEQAMFPKLSHKELLDYLREGQVHSFPAQYLQILIRTLALVAVVEGVAFVIRRAMGLFQPSGIARARAIVDL